MKKVLIKPHKNVKLPQEVLDVQDRIKKTPLEEMLDLVKYKDFSKAMVQDEFGNLILGIAFSLDNRVFIGVTPNPIDMYYGTAYTFLEHSKKILANIKLQKEEEKTQVVFLKDNKFNSFLQIRISCIIMLHSTLEAFINSIIPDKNYFYPRNVKENGLNVVKNLTKEQIEQLNFSEKFKYVVKSITKIDFATTNYKLYMNLISLNKLRNDLIHLRTMKDGKKDSYVPIFASVIKSDLEKYFDDVREYINTIEPDTIQFTEPNDAEK